MTTPTGNGSAKRDENLECQLMVEEARRSLDGQKENLDNAKSRTSTLLGVSGLVLPLSSALTAAEANRVWGILAIASFLIAVSYAGYVLWPHTFTFEMDTEALILTQDKAATTEHYLRSVAGSLGQYRHENAPAMSKLTNAYMAAAVFVGLEVIALGMGAVIG
jgi:hypothetical protein